MWYGSFMATIWKWMIISFWNIDIMLTMATYTRVSLLNFIITYFFNYDEYHDLWIWIVETYTDRYLSKIHWTMKIVGPMVWRDETLLNSYRHLALYVWQYKLMTASVPGQVLRDIKELSTDPNPTRSPHNQAILSKRRIHIFNFCKKKH